MHLFWVKRVSGNYFTPLCVFGKLKKFGQMEINFRVDCKITLFWCKTILAFILTSNQLQDSKMKRERGREHIHHRPAKLRHRSPITDPSSPIPHHRPAKLRHKHPSPIPHLSPPSLITDPQTPKTFLSNRLAFCSRHHHPRSILFSTHPKPISSSPLKTDLSFPIYLSFPQSFNLSLFDL